MLEFGLKSYLSVVRNNKGLFLTHLFSTFQLNFLISLSSKPIQRLSSRIDNTNRLAGFYVSYRSRRLWGRIQRVRRIGNKYVQTIHFEQTVLITVRLLRNIDRGPTIRQLALAFSVFHKFLYKIIFQPKKSQGMVKFYIEKSKSRCPIDSKFDCEVLDTITHVLEITLVKIKSD